MTSSLPTAAPPPTSSGIKMSSTSPVVLDAQSVPGVTSNISLHPLPILNVSEHLVRTRLQSNDEQLEVFGVLLGTQIGRDIDIQNSFEIRVENGLIDDGFLKARQAQYKQVFPTLEPLGWYTVGTVPLPRDVEIHKQVLAYNETPLLLQLHPTVSSFATADKDGELPLHVYESVVEILAGEATTFFVPIGYKIETGEAERIAVDHTSKTGAETEDGLESSRVANLMAQHSAISKLYDRIKLVTTYVEGVKSGTLPKDDETLRQINAVVSNLPSTGLDELKDELLKEYNDVLLTTLLSTLTKGTHVLNEFSDKSYRTRSGNKEELTMFAGMP